MTESARRASDDGNSKRKNASADALRARRLATISRNNPRYQPALCFAAAAALARPSRTLLCQPTICVTFLNRSERNPDPEVFMTYRLRVRTKDTSSRDAPRTRPPETSYPPRTPILRRLPRRTTPAALTVRRKICLRGRSPSPCAHRRLSPVSPCFMNHPGLRRIATAHLF